MPAFSKILIANRGEIACRIQRTAQALGYRTVAVFSEADADALHVRMADEAVLIGAAPVPQSYLNQAAILDAARRTGADAIHPGYGFLSENAGFAKACAEAGIVFIGPSPDAIDLMGSKRRSKIAMIAAGVPCIAGYEGTDQDDDTLCREAERIGYPLMIKASAGGGGRGMRLVWRAEDLLEQLRTARSEALHGFGNDELILEQALINPRHVEIQIFADHHGNLLHLGERDCSIQRRHQKIIEEAPCPVMTADLRQAMGDAALKAGRAVNYVGAGTVEFLLAPDGGFYFLEMNTRLQVEHPVTELITGLDLVAWQLDVAAGLPLPLRQDQVQFSGHAMEVRLYAEDPAANFLPQTGHLLSWEPLSATVYESTMVCLKARPSARSTTRCWAKSSPTALPVKRPDANCCEPWRTACSWVYRPINACWRGCWLIHNSLMEISAPISSTNTSPIILPCRPPPPRLSSSPSPQPCSIRPCMHVMRPAWEDGATIAARCGAIALAWASATGP